MQLKSLYPLEETQSVTVTKSGGTFVPSLLQHPDENAAERAGSAQAALPPACDSLAPLQTQLHSWFLPDRDLVRYVLPSGGDLPSLSSPRPDTAEPAPAPQRAGLCQTELMGSWDGPWALGRRKKTPQQVKAEHLAAVGRARHTQAGSQPPVRESGLETRSLLPAQGHVLVQAPCLARHVLLHDCSTGLVPKFVTSQTR